MKDIARDYLAQCPMNTTPWLYNDAASRLLEYVYSSGIWDRDYQMKSAEIRKKKISTLTENEIYTYLTVIIGGDRINEGLYDDSIANGTIEKLLRRYLEVTQ